MLSYALCFVSLLPLISCSTPLAVGGYGGSTLSVLTDAELILSAGEGGPCLADLPDLPTGKANYGAVSGVVNGQILICGGTNVLAVTNECVGLDLNAVRD